MIANGWVPIGPNAVFNGQTWKGNTAPVSGRVTAMAVDPKNPAYVYVGTASGGVWRSKDRGLSWTPLMDNEVSLAVGAMALDPSAPDADHPRLYVATGEGNQGGESLSGVGLMIFTDNPPGWILKGNDKLNGKRVYKMVLIPAASNEIWLATDQGLYHSLDDGSTWDGPIGLLDKAGHAIADPYQVTDMMYIPGTTDLYIAVRGAGVWKRHGAANFTILPAGGQGQLYGLGGIDRIGLACCRDQPKNMYVLYGKPATGKKDSGFLGIWCSDDGGATWTPRELPVDEGSNQAYTLALAVNPTDPKTVFFGETELWKSIDSAKSWKRVSESNGDSPGIHADQHVVAFADGEPTTVWAGNDGGVWVSSDGGDTFFSRNRGIQTIQYYSIAQHPHEASVILGGAQDNGVQRYEGSPAWDKVSSGDGFFCAIDPDEPFRCYSSYTYMSKGKVRAIQRSEKYGKADSFSSNVDGIKNTFGDHAKPFYTPFVLDPNNHKVLYLGTNRLYRTENFGDDWVAITDTTTGQPFTPVTPDSVRLGNDYFESITAIAVDPNDSKNVYVGTRDGRVIKLTQDTSDPNNHTRFKPSPASKPALSDFISDLLVPPGPNPNASVLVAIGSPQLAWTAVTDLPAGRIWVNSGSNAPGAAHDTWTSLYDANLDLTIRGTQFKHSSNPVNAIAVDAKDPANPVFYIGCNLGVFKRKGYAAGPEKWTLYNENLPNVAIGDLQFHSEKRLLRAATIGRSTWERAVDAPNLGSSVEVYIRDNMADVGRPPTPPQGKDPTTGDDITPLSGADIRIGTPFLGIGSFTTPASTVDYTKNGAADYLAFVQFGSDSLRRGVKSRIYAQVINRGPDDDSSPYKVRAFWGGKTASGYPKLPNDFWTALPDKDPDTTNWKPFGKAVQIDPPLRACEPKVVSWEYEMPKDAPDTVGVLVLVTGSDGIVNGPFDVEQLAPQDRHVAMREVTVRVQATAIIVPVAILLGLAAVGATAGAIYAATKKK